MIVKKKDWRKYERIRNSNIDLKSYTEHEKKATVFVIIVFILKGGIPMYFGIATFPEKEVQDIANSYRKRYDPHYSLIPPHITLKEKFEWINSKWIR